jgi:hypothetical protein
MTKTNTEKKNFVLKKLKDDPNTCVWDLHAQSGLSLRQIKLLGNSINLDLEVRFSKLFDSNGRPVRYIDFLKNNGHLNRKEVSKLLSIPPSFVTFLCFQFGLSLRDKTDADLISKEVLDKLVKERKTVKDIARMTGRKPATVASAMIRHNVRSLKRKSDLESRSLIQNEVTKIKNSEKHPPTAEYTAEKLGVTVCRVRKEYKKQGIKRKTLKERATLISSQLEDGHTCREIADNLGVCRSHLVAVMRQNGLTSESTTRPQQQISEFVTSLGVNHELNYKKAISPFELDIFCPNENLAFELDGYYWHAEGVHKEKLNVNRKHVLAKEKGIRTIHFLDTEWENSRKACENVIRSALNKNCRIVYARNCYVEKISFETASLFLKQHHLQGSCVAKIFVGIFLGLELLGVCTIGKSRYQRKADYELLRLAFKSDVSVVGGSSKLFKFATKNIKGTVISYCDKRFFSGEVYSKLGFVKLKDSPSGYCYVGADLKKYNRVSFQKHKLKDKLAKFDPEKTEFENMRQNGYHRVWDAGQSVFSLELT